MSQTSGATVTMRYQRLSPISRLACVLVAIVGLAAAAITIITPLDLQSQAFFGLFTAVVFLVINRFRGRAATLCLMALSAVVSTRYLWWRTTETLGFSDPFDMVFGYGLYAAELYAWVVLIIGYFQVLWPLDRKPVPLPADTDLWPTVDVFIPTYNESLDVVRPTVLAAMAMDYPPDKFKVFLLDDGRRPEFAKFAAEAGCGYIIRSDNRHAKAGNLNNALTVTDGRLIAIFDCDHVPTRAFLQMTVGWFLHDPKLAMVQTPHHFYSPDPFERNLDTYGKVPNEGQLFYGLIQQGNDFWNAAFFCGSCAVLSREALVAVGGVQHQTVTEDAHTALRMQRQGWNTAYLRLPLAAGLATERLSVHVGQRMRWARGMIQIFRIDNPLLGRGLKLGQRICYLNAMMYFLYPLPRFVFLTAPIAYLLLQQNIIMASALMVMAYAGPHMFHALGTQSRLAGRFRYSFWGEIYDNVLLFHILRPTLLALINPKAGKFNVTDKGSLLEEELYDTKVMRPLLILSAVLVFAIGVGIYRYYGYDLYPGEANVIVMNIVWTCYSLFTLMAALAVGRERRQVRTAPRITVQQPITLYFDGRRSILGKTQNMSLGGALLTLDDAAGGMVTEDSVLVGFDALDGGAVVPARIVAASGRSVRLAFQPESLDDERTIVRAVFGRADAWLNWDDRPGDNLGRSFTYLASAIGTLLGVVLRRRKSVPAPTAKPADGAGAASLAKKAAASLLVAAVCGAMATTLPPTRHAAAQPAQAPMPPVPSTLDMGGLALPLGVVRTQATETPAGAGQLPSALPAIPPGVSPMPGAGGATPPPGIATPPAVPLPTEPRSGESGPPGARQAPPSGPSAPSAERPQPGALPAGLPGPTANPASSPYAMSGAGQSRQYAIQLRDLGLREGVRLEGVAAEAGVPFSARQDDVFVGARLSVIFSFSPAVGREEGELTVLINNEPLGMAPLRRDKVGTKVRAEFAVNPALLTIDNRLQFKLTVKGRQAAETCKEARDRSYWLRVDPESFIYVSATRVVVRDDLALLPRPFVDPKDPLQLSLPFVLPADPDPDVLQAAGVMAGYFGLIAQYKGATFPVSIQALPASSAVVFVLGDRYPTGVAPVPGDGPRVAIVANPAQPDGKLLLVVGRDSKELQQAATTVALEAKRLSGSQSAAVPGPQPQRQPYDAPKWISTDRPVRLGDVIDPALLSGPALGDVVRLSFRTPPDLFFGDVHTVPLLLRLHRAEDSWIDPANSRINVALNGNVIGDIPLEPRLKVLSRLTERLFPHGPEARANQIFLPTAQLFSANRLDFFFDLRTKSDVDCATRQWSERTGIDPDSSIDLTGMPRFVALPNLALFANAGFPFTQLADLSETAFVLPASPAPDEIQTFLNLLAHFADATGLPATRFMVATPASVGSVAHRHLVVIGLEASQPLHRQWQAQAPFRLTSQGVAPGSPLSRTQRFFQPLDPRQPADAGNAFDLASQQRGKPYSFLASYWSPLDPNRLVVALGASQGPALVALGAAFRDPGLNPRVQGDFFFLTDGKGDYYSSGRRTFVGELPPWTHIRWIAESYGWAAFVGAICGTLLFGLAIWQIARYRAARRLATV